jgi:predicted alpha/beta-fold hydrolase
MTTSIILRLFLFLHILVACRPEISLDLVAPTGSPRTPSDFWLHLGAIALQKKQPSWMAMLTMAHLARKRRDQGDGACGPPPGRDPAEGAHRVLIDLDHRPRPVLFYPPRPGRPTVILVHGLFDSKYTRYMEKFAHVLIEGDFGVLIPDMRWHGCRFRDSLPTLGHGEAEDLAELSRWVQSRHPTSAIGLIGFSLGALYVIHALARDDAPRLFAAGGIAFSPPGNLHDTLTWLDRPDADFYARLFRGWLSSRMRASQIEPGKTPFRSLLARLAQEQGRADPSALLAEADPAAHLARVSRPLYLVSALDDPYFTGETVQYLQRAAASSACVRVKATEAGGHIGHLAAYPGWTRQTILEFFNHAASMSCAGKRR